MKLSLLIPTFNSAATIERTLSAALAQRYRPLEILVYDEASRDATREVVSRLLAGRAHDGIEVDFWHSDANQGPVKAWRVPLQRATGDWCCFVWADDVLSTEYSETMMAAARRAQEAGRRLAFCSAQVEIDGNDVAKFAVDGALISPEVFSLGIFLRRYSVNQVGGVYETATAREVFDRHIEFENPLGFDFNWFPYGNDVGFLSELAAAGEGVELVPQRLVRLVLSGNSMTREALAVRVWQMRWQYTFNQLRVWRFWAAEGRPASSWLVRLAERRLALCELFLERGKRRITPLRVFRGLAAVADYVRLDYERRPRTFESHRGLIQRRVARGSR